MKNPTNSDLLREFKTMQGALLIQGESIKKLDGRVANIEKKNLIQEGVKQGIAEYRSNEKKDSTTIDARVVGALVAALGALTTVILLLSRH